MIYKDGPDVLIDLGYGHIIEIWEATCARFDTHIRYVKRDKPPAEWKENKGFFSLTPEEINKI